MVIKNINMRALLLTATICLLYVSSMFAQENNKSIRVNISGLDSSEGMVMVVLFNSADSFLKKPCFRQKAMINNNKANLSFENIKAGTYAIMCFHDENANNKLDRSILGIPKESVAASNNAKGNFGPPKFEDASFILKNEDVVQNIEFSKQRN